MLVLVFALLALPMSGVAAAETYQGKFSDWTAAVGSISRVSGGVFQLDAYDSSKPKDITNTNHARFAIWQGDITTGKISVTVDTASLLAGRADGKSGNNDTGLVFAGKGLKSISPVLQGNNGVASYENGAQWFWLYWSGNTLILRTVNNGFSNGKDIKRVDLSSNANWTAATTAGKVKLTVEWDAQGAVKVWLGDNTTPVMDVAAADSAVPFGTEVAFRASMGHHVPTKIYSFEVSGTGLVAPQTGDITFVVGAGAVLLTVIGSALIVSKKRSIA